MIEAIIFDFFQVLEQGGEPNGELLGYIKNQLRPKYKIGIISNSSGRGIQQVLANRLDLFDDIVVSAEVGLFKPQPEIYQLAAKRLKLRPSECVYIDDENYRVDGALNAGMQGIVYTDFGQMKKELENLLTTTQ